MWSYSKKELCSVPSQSEITQAPEIIFHTRIKPWSSIPKPGPHRKSEKKYRLQHTWLNKAKWQNWDQATDKSHRPNQLQTIPSAVTCTRQTGSLSDSRLIRCSHPLHPILAPFVDKWFLVSSIKVKELGMFKPIVMFHANGVSIQIISPRIFWSIFVF